MLSQWKVLNRINYIDSVIYIPTTHSQLRIQNYNLENLFCLKIHKGGIAISTKQNLSCELSPWPQNWISNHLSAQSAIIGLPVAPSTHSFANSNHFSVIGRAKNKFIFLGDLHINVLDRTDHVTKRLNDCLSSFGFTWPVNSPPE